MVSPVLVFLEQLAKGGTDTVIIKWPYDGGGDGIHMDKLLAQQGVKVYERRTPSVGGGDFYSVGVSKKQAAWAYELLLTSGREVVSPAPFTPRLQRLQALSREQRMALRNRTSWGAPVRHRGPLGAISNTLMGDIKQGMKPSKDAIKREVKREAGNIFKRIIGG